MREVRPQLAVDATAQRPAPVRRTGRQWWRPGGAFAMLHWLAEARARADPAGARPGAVLVDLGCGAGLLAPHVAGKGYRHVGVDLSASALARPPRTGSRPVRGDVHRGAAARRVRRRGRSPARSWST